MMRPKMTWRRLLAATLLAVVCAGPAWADKESKEKKRDAEEMYKMAKKEADPDLQAQEMCQAAASDKKYQKDCNELMDKAVKRQMDRLTLAADALDARHDFRAARELARKVSGMNDDLLARKSALLARIDAAERAANEHKAPVVVDHSQEYLTKMDNDFARGDFISAITDFQQIKNPAIKVAAQHRKDDIDHYNSLISQAQTMEQGGNLTGAINAFQAAQQICANGPGNVAAEIGMLNDRLKHKGSGTNGVNGSSDDGQFKALITAAHEAENAKHWQDALDKYNAALKVSPYSRDATQGVARVQPLLAKAPGGEEKILRDAIRAYYSSSFESAKTSLGIYLNGQDAANRGTADFYMGAAVLEQWILKNPTRNASDVPQDAISSFKKARSEGYKPLPSYVSPAVMKVWESAGM